MQLPDWIETEWNEIKFCYTWGKNDQEPENFTYKHCDISRKLQFIFCCDNDMATQILKNYGNLDCTLTGLKTIPKCIHLKFKTKQSERNLLKCLKEIAERATEMSINLKSSSGQQFNKYANKVPPSLIRERKAMVLRDTSKEHLLHCVAFNEETIDLLLEGIGFNQADVTSIKQDDVNKKPRKSNDANIKSSSELETKYTLEVGLYVLKLL